MYLAENPTFPMIVMWLYLVLYLSHEKLKHIFECFQLHCTKVQLFSAK